MLNQTEKAFRGYFQNNGSGSISSFTNNNDQIVHCKMSNKKSQFF